MRLVLYITRKAPHLPTPKLLTWLLLFFFYEKTVTLLEKG